MTTKKFSQNSIIDEVFSKVPIRQWVLSFPVQLRFLLARHPELMGKVLSIVYRTLSTHPIKTVNQIDPDNWKTLTTQFERSFNTFVGEPKTLANTTLSLGYQRSPGLSACRALLQ